jgi:sugar lactone lactonase YvrE
VGLALIGTKLYVSDNGNHTVRVIDLTPGADATSGFVNTLAGSAGAAGSVTGIGSAARFRLPAGIASDGATLLKVADWGNDVVREIVASTANVSTLAGDPASRGYANGTGMAALFNYPRGVATDASGNAYVADSLNHVIRRVTPAGVTTLFAGTPGVIGLDASPSVAATSAHFNNPVGIAVSSTGDVYVADRANNAIRKISGGNVTVVAAGAPLNGPRGVVVASNGDLYVANTSGHTIVKIVGATVTTFAGTGVAGSSGDGMAASSATFRQPGAVALDGNTLYVADTGNFRVRKIDLNTGVVTAFVGANGIQGTQNGTGSGAQFGAIDGLAVDAAQNVYIADTQSHQIRKATSPGGVVTTLAGAASIGVATGALPGSLNLPSGVAVAPSTVPGSTRLVLTDGVEHAILEAIVKP